MNQTGSTDLWSDILKSADRRNRGRAAHGRKNVVLLSERHRGRSYLLSQLAKKGSKKVAAVKPSLAVGYEVLDVKEDGDEDTVPPVSVFYPPNSHPALLRLIPQTLPPKSLADTAVMILLDWSKPSSMINELLGWLHWVEQWASDSAEQGQAEELRERLQSHIQHYAEPSSSTPSSSLAGSMSTYSGGPLLPLGAGSLTLNSIGIPIIIVCSRADQMDKAGEEVGMKGQWEEKTDWIQQVLRTISLAYGAALFYTAPTQPQTYTLLRQYLLHRLYTIPPPLHPTDHSASKSVSTPAPTTATPFPFARRANVLDRDAVMVPAGWDSYGKINVLRDRFDPARILRAWESSLSSVGETTERRESEGIEDVWNETIPDTSRPRPSNAASATTTSEPEQTFLQRQLESLQKDPNRDPRASFRQAAAAVSASSAVDGGANAAGVVGPMGAGGLSLPGVERAMAEMEGGSAEEMKEKFARLGRRETKAGPLSPGEAPGRSGAAVPNEALHNFFQGLLATKGKAGTPAKSPSATPAPRPEKE